MGLLRTARFIIEHPIGRRRPLRGLLELLRWQIGSRLLPGPVVVDWVGPTQLVVEPGMTGATGNIYVGLHEFSEMGFVLHLLRPGDLMLDVGANVGSYTILAAGAVGAQVHAFEPVVSTMARLARNVRANGLDSRVALHNMVVGSTEGRVRIQTHRDTMNRVLSENDRVEENETCAMMTALDSIFSGESPALIKIDVEGFEREVLTGARQILLRTAAVVVEVTRYVEEVFALLEGAGLRACGYDPMTRQLRTLHAAHVGLSGNMLFVRDVEWAALRCKSAPRFAVKGMLV